MAPRWPFHRAFALLIFAAGCSGTALPFAAFQRELFDPTPLTLTQEKTVRFVNPSATEPQRIAAIGFDAGGNPGAHFQIAKVASAGHRYGMNDIVVPAGAALEIVVRYAPRDLATTEATYAGWETGQPSRYEPQPPAETIKVLVAATRQGGGGSGHRPLGAPRAATQPEAVHRALLLLTYAHPNEGVIQIELVGRAVPGPHGELTAPGGGGTPTAPGECEPAGTRACFTGTFAIELPGLMEGGPVRAPLSGPLPIAIDGNAATLAMNDFPPVVFVVKGNGPGEPLEGKPVGAITIVVSGAADVVATGSFDGAQLELTDVGFRVRIYLAELSLETAEATTAPADFLVNALTLATTEPLTDGAIRMRIETTLSARPANDPLIDPFLAGAQVIVELAGTLALP